MSGRLFTIGHSNHDFGRFAQLLSEHAVAVIADVRSAPYSRFVPQYNREPLSAALARAGIEYEYLGRELGARRSERECYVAGVARYDRIARTPAFRSGLDRVKALAAERVVALMCAEKDPLTCHRTILVAHQLRIAGMHADHILEDGRIESTDGLEERLLRSHFPDGDLFRSRAELIEAAYERHAEPMQYCQADPDASSHAFH